MSFYQVLTDPGSLRKLLFCVAAASAAAAFVIKRVREKRSGEPRVIRLTLDTASPSAPAAEQPPAQEATVEAEAGAFQTAGPPESAAAPAPSPAPDLTPQPQTYAAVATSELPEPQAPETLPPAVVAEPETETVSGAAYSFLTLQDRSPVLMDILRGALIMIAVVAAGALLLVALPQPAVDRLAVALKPRNAPGPPPEKIAFLYLGDEVKDNQFHIRGVVRNISSQAIEQLEATVRIYAPDHTLLETQVVRMDTDTIFPNATASFHLSFPEYHGQFGSYSLDFKLAQGDPVPYKDMREARASS